MTIGETELGKDKSPLNPGKKRINEIEISEYYSNISSIAKKRGFYWNSFDIYGGVSGFYDYGDLGSMMRDNIISVWKDHFVYRHGMMLIDGTVIFPEQVFLASGHVGEFSDLMTKCDSCSELFRCDILIEEFASSFIGSSENIIRDIFNNKTIPCPNCGGNFLPPEKYNLMFSTEIGPNSLKTGYLRPETAQAIFINFQNYYRLNRNKLPFGVVQIGRSFRNEVAPRQGLFRLREFTQMEAEIFYHPRKKFVENFFEIEKDVATFVDENGEIVKCTFKEAMTNKIIINEILAYYMAITQRFLLDVGIDAEKLRFRQHRKDELSHYSSDCWDVEMKIFEPNGKWLECVGIADRTDFDLRVHSEMSNKKLMAFETYDEPVKKSVTKIKPIMRQLGRNFNTDAKRIAEKLKNLDESDIEKNGDIKITIEDRKFIIDENYYEIVIDQIVKTGEYFFPFVIEPSFGLDRLFYAIMEHNYNPRDKGLVTEKNQELIPDEIRTSNEYNVFSFPSSIAPIKAGVFPIISKSELVDVARKITVKLNGMRIRAILDTSGSIGKRYARMDEIGTPFCITIDHETLSDNTATIRFRDTGKQTRLPLSSIPNKIKSLIDQHSL